MKKNMLALWMALCLLMSALPVEALSESDYVRARDVDAEVTEQGGDALDLADLEDPEDQYAVEELDGLELSEICDVPDGAQDGAASVEKAPAATSDAGDGDAVDVAGAEDTEDAEGLSVENADETEQAPEEKNDDKPAPETPVKPAEKADEKAGEKTDEQSGEKADKDTPAKPVENAAENTAEKPAQDASGKPAEPDEKAAEDEKGEEQDQKEDKSENVETPGAPGAEDGDAVDEKDGEKNDEKDEEKDSEKDDSKDDGKDDIMDGEPEESDGEEEKSPEAKSGEKDGEDEPDAEDKAETAEASETGEKEDAEDKEKADDEDKKDGEDKKEADEAAEGDGQTEVGEEHQSNALMEPAATLSLDQTSVTVPMQGSVTLKASGGTGTVTWTSENAASATVDANGVVTAVAVGSARIVAKDEKGAQAACDVTVIEVPPDVGFEAVALQIGLRETRRLPRLIWDGGAKVYQGTVSYSSANAKKVTVTADGQVRGVARGSATIVATFPDGKALQCAVTVKKAPKKITVKPKKRSMGVGEALQLGYSLSAGSAGAVTWSSSNPAVVAVNAESGLAVAQGVGTARITARTYNKKRATVKITVYAVPTPVVVATPGKVLRIGKGDRVRLQTAAGDGNPVVSCTSRNSKVVRAEGGGVIYGVKKGSANVIVRTASGRMRVKIVVRRAPRWIAASPNPLNLGVGETYTLGYKTPAGTSGSVLFKGDAPSVFSVNEATGQITGVAPGTGTVTLVSYNGKVATCPVTVHAAPTSVAFDPAQTSVGKKQKLQLRMLFNEGAWSNITYELDNPKVAKVSADGVVTGVSVGQTVLRARTYIPGLFAETVFTVWGPPSRVWLDQKGLTVQVGQTFKLEPRIPAGSQTTFTFKSSRKSVATVAADGTVTPLKKGTTKITVTTHNKKKVTLKLTVKKATTPTPTPTPDTLCTTIPARTTGVDGIAANLGMINDIKSSAFKEIDRLKSTGALTAESAARRKEIVENIFSNYAFPWMTPSLQKYWKAANSENGAKDFKPDVVYYGMPYISGSGANRRYSAALAVSEGRYTDSGLGYYVLNKSNYLNGKYVGNDCSGLVNVSIWGTGSSHSADRTEDIFKSTAYNTVSDYGAMLPGDLICKSNAHVVMFLYYTSEDKSTFMMIENGGSEKGTNTVHCDIKTVSGYKKSGYRVRRLAGL
ncbi:MAG: Ig-like domain-containing protein [Clostridia bacterium]|nr:Ig-like domain-containing protein [Clostridia bacterium]